MPTAIGLPVSIFEKYATGRYTFATLGAEVGMAPERVREILAAPIFNGYFRRGKRSQEERREAAPWRANPPVPDELWERVQEVRRRKAHGGGPRRRDRVDLLAGLLYCPCGRHIKANGTSGSGVVRAHPAPCEQWGARATYPVRTWLDPLAAQVQQIDLSPTTIAQVVSVLGQPAPSADQLASKRLERQRKEAAEAFAIGRMTLEDFTQRVADLHGQQRSLETAVRADAAPISADVAITYLKDMKRTWEAADDPTRADLLHAIYERVEVRGDAFVMAHLTPEAEAHGLALALPELVAMARPAGIEPAT